MATHTSQTNDRPSLSAAELERVLRPHEAGAWMGDVSVRTLKWWRHKGVGPPWVRLGHGATAPVGYRIRDVLEWLEARRHTPRAKNIP